jgi:hypothetical protein
MRKLGEQRWKRKRRTIRIATIAPAESKYDNVERSGSRRGFESVLEELVLLREGDGYCGRGVESVSTKGRGKKGEMLTIRVLLVEVSGETAELEELVLLEAGGETEGVESVVGVDRVAEGLVVLLLDKQVVERLVDCRNVVLQWEVGSVSLVEW